MDEPQVTDEEVEEVQRQENEAWLEARELYDPDTDPEVLEERRQDPTMNEDAADLDLTEYERQWEAFDARWRAHPGVAEGPLDVRQAVLRTEPPRVVLGREGNAEQVSVALGREQAAVTFRARSTGEELSLPAAARALGVHPVEMDRARAAILDGLEQSEAAAGRTPADRAGADRSRDGHGLRDGEFQIQADAILDRVDPVLDDLFQGIKVDVTLRESAGKTVATITDAEDGSDRRVVATPRSDGSLDYRTKDGNPLAFDHEVADLLGLSTKDTGDMLRGLESGYRDASAATLAHRGDGAARQPSPTREPAPEQTSVRARNAERMARQVPAGIRDEEPGESLRRAAPRPSR